MPSISIHEEVGYYISQKIGVSSYDYYLGLLAPDSPNLEGFAEKQERWTSHQRKANYQEWRESLKKFYRKEKENYSHDFILGYIIHVLTDIVYDEFIYLSVIKKIGNNSIEEAHPILREDMNQYTFPEMTEIKNILQEKDTAYDILNIPSEIMIKWKNKSINTILKENHSQYETLDVIEELNKKVYQELIEEWL